MANVEILAENEVTKETLATLFKRAFMSTSIDDGSDLLVRTDGVHIWVNVDEDKKLLKYMTVYGVKKSSPLELRHALVNKMNNRMIFGRFSIHDPQPDMLIAECFLPYEESIPTFQIISAIRLFAQVAPGAIRACDDNGLVE